MMRSKAGGISAGAEWGFAGGRALRAGKGATLTWTRWLACAKRSAAAWKTSWCGTTMAANPFDLLPANLFNLFSTLGHTTLQRHYMAILLRLYTLAEFNRFGLAREVVVAEIVDYLRAAGAQAEAEVAAEMAEQDAGGIEGASLPSASLPSASLPSASLPSTSLPSTSLPSASLPSA